MTEIPGSNNSGKKNSGTGMYCSAATVNTHTVLWIMYFADCLLEKLCITFTATVLFDRVSCSSGNGKGMKVVSDMILIE